MDTLGIAGLATSMANTATQQAVGTAVLKKALDSQSAAASALISALPQPQRLPSNLGNTINTTA